MMGSLLSSILLYVSFVYVFEQTFARYVDNENGMTGEQSFKCHCTVMAQMYDDSPFHNFGVIQTLHMDPAKSVADGCHHIRHRCKKECALRSDLSADIEINRPLGAELCSKLGFDTPRKNAAHMISYARLEGSGCGLRGEDGEASESEFLTTEVKDEHFCCGHTFVGNKGEKRYGWNPDCTDRSYVLV